MPPPTKVENLEEILRRTGRRVQENFRKILRTRLVVVSPITNPSGIKIPNPRFLAPFSPLFPPFPAPLPRDYRPVSPSAQREGGGEGRANVRAIRASVARGTLTPFRSHTSVQFSRGPLQLFPIFSFPEINNNKKKKERLRVTHVTGSLMFQGSFLISFGNLPTTSRHHFSVFPSWHLWTPSPSLLSQTAYRSTGSTLSSVPNYLWDVRTPRTCTYASDATTGIFMSNSIFIIIIIIFFKFFKRAQPVRAFDIRGSCARRSRSPGARLVLKKKSRAGAPYTTGFWFLFVISRRYESPSCFATLSSFLNDMYGI